MYSIHQINQSNTYSLSNVFLFFSVCPPPSNVIDKLIPPTTFAAAKYRVDSGSNNQQQTPPANISDWRRCNSTGVCFWSIFLCDGWSICEDGTDESGVGCSDYDRKHFLIILNICW